MEYAVIYIMKCLCIMNVRRIGIKKWEQACPLKNYIDYIEKLKLRFIAVYP